MKQKQRILSLLLALCLLVCLFPTAALAAVSDDVTMPFTDVRSEDWFFEAVQDVYGQHLMAGTTQTTFSPDAPLSRGMFVTVLGRLAGVNAAQDAESGFSDVPKGAYCSAYVAWAANLGIVSGYGSGQFGIHDPVTREQMAAILARYLSAKGLTLPDGASAAAGFRDADSAAAYARDGLELMRRTGILTGDAAGNFLPRNTATRAQAAVVFMRLRQAIEQSKAPTVPTGGSGSSGGSSGGSGGGTGGSPAADSASISSEGKVYAITGLSVSGQTVACTVGTQEACRLTVRFLDETTGAVLGTAETAAAKGLEEATVTASFSAVLPAHYRAEAVLTDAGGRLLCNPYVCMAYTTAQERFDKLTVNDFTGETAERVINFDADPADNFGVLAASVLKMDGNSSQNTLTAAENGVYTFANATAALLGVKPGDAVYVDGGSGQQTLLRVGSVSVNGTAVTLTEDDSAALSDFYAVLKLDMDVAITNEEQPQSCALQSQAGNTDTQTLSAVGEEPLYAVQLFGDSPNSGDSGSKSLSVKLDLSVLAVNSHISAEGTCSVHIQTEYDPEIFGEDYLYYEYTVENAMDTEFAIMAGVTDEMVAAILGKKLELVLFDGALPIPSVPGLEGFLTLSIPLEFDITSGLKFSTHTSDKRGVIFNAQTGAQIVNEQTSSTQLPYAAEFEASLSLRLYSGVQLMGSALQMGIDARGGVELEAEMNPDAGIEKPEGYHACGACLSGKSDCFASIGLTGSYNINKILYGDFLQVTAAKVTWNDENFYISLQNEVGSPLGGVMPHYGENACPNWKYPVTIETLDNHGSPVADVTVTVYNSAEQVVTTGQSPLTVQLYRNVNYSAKATVTGAEASSAFDVTGSGAKVTLKAPQGTLNGTVTDRETGNPIENATVTVSKAGVTYRTGKTGADGSYAISLPDDSWQVEISAYGYEPSQAADNAVSTHSGQKTVLDKALERTGGTIAGIVTDAQSNTAISGAAVGIYQDGTRIKSCTTDANGGYDSGKLPAGTYTVKFSAAGYGNLEKSATVTAVGSVAVHAALIKGSGTLSGTVSDSADEPQPISGAAVALYQNDVEISSTATDSTGAYSLALAAGDYTIRVTKDGYGAYSGSVSVLGGNTTPRDVTLYPGGTCGDNLCWEIKDSTLTISGTGPMYNYYSTSQYDTNLAPWLFLEGFTSIVIESGATTVGNAAFDGMRSDGRTSATGLCYISSISIPDTVTSIGKYAFQYCGTGYNGAEKHLTSVVIPDSVTTIGEDAFYSCQAVSTLTLSQNLSYIGSCAFQNLAITSIDLPASLTKIGDSDLDGGSYSQGIFYGCALTSVTIPATVTEIGPAVFYRCQALEQVTIQGATVIGDNAFGRCTALTTISAPEVTTIGDDAFQYCTSLTTVSLPKVTALGTNEVSTGQYNVILSSGAFANCTALKNVSLPKVTYIGTTAFDGCTALQSISLPELTACGMAAFRNCTGLQSFSLPKITAMPSLMFENCTSLTNVTVPSEVNTYYDSTFYRCAITMIDFSQTTIARLYYCNAETLKLPATLTSVSNNAFYACPSTIYYAGSEADWTALLASNPNLSTSDLANTTMHYNYAAS